MQDLVTNLWFDRNAEEAATFYTSLLPDSRMGEVQKAPADYPGGRKGDPLIVQFTLFGRPFVGINGGPQFPFTEAVSLEISCDDQAEVDHFWEKLTADGGSEGPCGWCKDRFGLSWQIVPRRLTELMASPDPQVAERVMTAMLGMHKIDVAGLEAAAEARAA